MEIIIIKQILFTSSIFLLWTTGNLQKDQLWTEVVFIFAFIITTFNFDVMSEFIRVQQEKVHHVILYC